MNKDFKSFSSGFTLMEVMVVLVIVSLVTTLMMQGFSFVMQIRMGLLHHQEQQVTDRLFSHWFQKIVGGISPGFDDPDGWIIDFHRRNSETNSFSGTPSTIRGLTFSALGKKSGVPAPFFMELRQAGNTVDLYYGGGRKKEGWQLGAFAAKTAQFLYLDHTGRWHDQWPPEKKWQDRVPRGISLSLSGPGGQQVWFSEIPGRLTAKPTLRTIFGDLTAK
jgi:general secretion pathway protein J